MNRSEVEAPSPPAATAFSFFALWERQTRTDHSGMAGRRRTSATDMNLSRQTTNTNTIIHTVSSAPCVARAIIKHTFHWRCQPVHRRHMPEQQKHAQSYWDTWAFMFTWLSGKELVLFVQSRSGRSERGQRSYTCPYTLMCYDICANMIYSWQLKIRWQKRRG